MGRQRRRCAVATARCGCAAGWRCERHRNCHWGTSRRGRRLGHTRSGGGGQRHVIRDDNRRPWRKPSRPPSDRARRLNRPLDQFSRQVDQSVASAPTEGTAATHAIAQAGGAGQRPLTCGKTAYAFTVGDPDKAYTATLIGFEGNRRRVVGPIFGAAILGANYASGGDESDITPQPRRSISSTAAISRSA